MATDQSRLIGAANAASSITNATTDLPTAGPIVPGTGLRKARHRARPTHPKNPIVRAKVATVASMSVRTLTRRKRAVNPATDAPNPATSTACRLPVSVSFAAMNVIADMYTITATITLIDIRGNSVGDSRAAVTPRRTFSPRMVPIIANPATPPFNVPSYRSIAKAITAATIPRHHQRRRWPSSRHRVTGEHRKRTRYGERLSLTESVVPVA